MENGIKKGFASDKANPNNISGSQTRAHNINNLVQSQSKSLRFLRVLHELTGGNGDDVTAFQTLHYLLREPHLGITDSQGRRWIYNTLDQWKENFFPDWDRKTISRIFLRLEELHLIESSNQFNSEKTNTRKWYTINYQKIADSLSAQNKTFPKNDTGYSVQDVSIRNETILKFDTRKNDFNVSAENVTIPKNDTDVSNLRHIITNNKLDISITPPIPIQPNEGVPRGNSEVGEVVGNETIFSPAAKSEALNRANQATNDSERENPFTTALGENSTIDNDLQKPQSGHLLSRAEDKKFREDAIEILCAVNEARAKLKHMRPKNDPGELLFDYKKEENLIEMIRLLSTHPKATKEKCLEMVEYRAWQVKHGKDGKPAPENFRHINASWIWSEKNFDSCLARMALRPMPQPKPSTPRQKLVDERPDVTKEEAIMNLEKCSLDPSAKAAIARVLSMLESTEWQDKPIQEPERPQIDKSALPLAGMMDEVLIDIKRCQQMVAEEVG